MRSNKPTPSFNTVKKSNRQARHIRKKYSRVLLLAIFATAALLLLTSLVFGVCLFIDSVTDEPEAPTPSLPDNNNLPAVEYDALTKPFSAYRQGVLINVNAAHSFDFQSKQNLIDIEENREKYQGEFDTYFVNNPDWKLDAEALNAFNQMMSKHYEIFGDEEKIYITSAYRSYQDQADLPTSAIAPGQSDHHTGLCVAIMVKQGSELNAPDSNHWIYQNCHKYGFVMRYPDEKKDITGLPYSYEYCLRYVGIPHATYIAENELCLEEYTQYLANHATLSSPLSITGADKKLYSVFYVKAEGDLTVIEIPKNTVYTVSGDNVGGFIVTLHLSDS